MTKLGELSEKVLKTFERGMNRKLFFAFCVGIFLFDTFVRSVSLIGAGALALALLPWVLVYVKSVKMPGGFEFVLKEVEQRIETELPQRPVNPELEREHVFLKVYEDDPNLALVGLRIEIERRLRKLADQHNISETRSLPRLVEELQTKGAIGHSVASIIRDMLPTLNSAAHAQDLPEDSGVWVLKNGPSLLDALDNKNVAQLNA